MHPPSFDPNLLLGNPLEAPVADLHSQAFAAPLSSAPDESSSFPLFLLPPVFFQAPSRPPAIFLNFHAPAGPRDCRLLDEG